MSNVPVTPGAGAKIATNQVTRDGVTEEVQLVNTLADGTWDYRAGVSGTPSFGATQRVVSILAHSTAGGTLVINSGNTITLIANSTFFLDINGNLTNPTLVFSGTDSYVVQLAT